MSNVHPIRPEDRTVELAIALARLRRENDLLEMHNQALKEALERACKGWSRAIRLLKGFYDPMWMDASEACDKALGTIECYREIAR